MQIKSKVPHVGSYPLEEINSRQELLKLFTAEQRLLENTLLALKAEIKEQEERNEKRASISRQEELKALREKIGLEPVTGRGVGILLADSLKADRGSIPPDESLLVQTSDIRDLVNVLFLNGAEAVSINNNRILPIFSLNFVGNSFLLNGFHLFPPFTVEAVGPVGVLKSSVTNELLLPDLLKRVSQKKLRLVISGEEDLNIPAFKGELSVNYLKYEAENQQ